MYSMTSQLQTSIDIPTNSFFLLISKYCFIIKFKIKIESRHVGNVFKWTLNTSYVLLFFKANN